LAIDGAIVQKGTVKIGMITPDPTYSDLNVSDYASVYKNTIIWLDLFATKNSPKDLNAPWSYMTLVGRPGVGLLDEEQVTVQAGSYKAWLIGWHRAVDNKIWVVPDLPFPVKAQVYTDVTSGVPPPYYTFELLETGNSLTEPQFLHRPIVNPPFPMPQKATGSDSVTMGTGGMCHDGMPIGFSTLVEVSTNPSRPVRGEPLLVSMIFTDSRGIEVFGQNYSITVTQDGKTILSNSTARYDNNGHDTQTTGSLESSDPVEINIQLGLRSENSHIRFDVPPPLIFRVVPELNTLSVPPTFYYVVKVSTNPPTPVSGQSMSISIKFTNYNGTKTPDEHYAITVTQDGKTIFYNSTAYTNTGFDTQTISTLESANPMDIKIALSYTPVFLTFHIVPEFPFAMVVLIIGIIVTLVITRIKWNQTLSFPK